MLTPTKPITVDDLPGLNCGLCGLRTCREMADRLATQPEYIERCIHLSNNRVSAITPIVSAPTITAAPQINVACGGCAVNERVTVQSKLAPSWHDTLGREFDFYLEHFPEEPGPREIMLPHNPMITR